MPPRPEWHLHIGSKFTSIAVRPDDKWPSMWRIHAPDRLPSDMVNLTRAKDAAVAWARPRGLGGEEEAHWRLRETPAGASSGGFSGEVATALI